MSLLLEFAVHHPFLVGAAVLMAVAALAYEIRLQSQSFAALSPMVAVRMMNSGALVLDVRNKEQYDAGHIGDARHMPVAELGAQAESLKKWRDKPVIAYCDTGASAGAAVKSLTQQGFSKVFNLAGGLETWRKDNLPLVKSQAK
jgi:rhodanese-related sulfurtransferase